MRGALTLTVVAAVVLGAAASAWAAFPGHNGELAFSALSEQGTEEIYAVPADGGNLGVNRKRLTVSPANGAARSPAWAPDGSRLAFIERTAESTFFLAVMDADGSGRRRVTRVSSMATVSWSPDGDTLVYTDGQGMFRTSSSSSSRGTFIGFGEDPDWSPDGDLIAFECAGSPICVSSPTGANRQVIGEGDDPEWSPDGAHIAFTRAGEIWTMGRDGSDPAAMTSDSSNDRAPVWSPRGDRVAFLSNRHLPPPPTGFPGIWSMAADGSDQHLLVFIAFSVDWQAIPNRPPDCTGLQAEPDLLWPPNRKLRLVTFSGASDPDGDVVRLEIVSVTQDEPVRGPGDPTRPDARPGGEGEVHLRAERAPRGDGRVYTVELEATDDLGATCRTLVKVTVPRHRSRPAVESPESFDSFAR